MKERKFKYHQPKNTREHIEAICEELSSSRSTNGRTPTETLKDHIVALLAHIKHTELRKELDKETNDSTTQFALFTLAFVAIVFIWNGWWSNSSDWEWLENHRFALKLWGIAFAAIYIGISIERSSIFKVLWSFVFTKLVASIAVSALLVFSTGKASSLINAVLGVDASVFPFTRAFISGILAFHYLSPLLIVVVFFAILYGIDVLGYIQAKFSSKYKYDLPPWNSFVFLLLAIIFLIASWLWVKRDFSEAAYPAKIHRLAHILDFNSRHSCANIKNGVSLAFVGSDQSKVLVDISEVQTEDIESFIDEKLSSAIAIPKDFFFLSCDPGNQPK